MITCPCNVYPLEPRFYIAKLGYAGVYLFFLFLLQNIDCGYSFEPPCRCGSNVYPQSMFRAKIRKISVKNCLERKFSFLEQKNFYILHGQIFRNDLLNEAPTTVIRQSHNFRTANLSSFCCMCTKLFTLSQTGLGNALN